MTPATARLRDQQRTSIAIADSLPILAALSDLETAVANAYRDAEHRVYAGRLHRAFLAIHVKARIKDAVAECMDRLDACRRAPLPEPVGVPLSDSYGA